MLRDALLGAYQDSRRERDSLGISVYGAKPGLYVQFEGAPGIDLSLDSLEHRGKGIELVAVHSFEAHQASSVQLATVYVPDGALPHFVSRFEEYATRDTDAGEPRHKNLVDRIAALRRATLRALWTDDMGVFPGEGESIWWEVWLRRQDGRELERLLDFAAQTGLEVGARRLAFPDRIVVLVRGAIEQLSASLLVLNDLAEVGRAKESAAFFVNLTQGEQTDWVHDLKERTTPPPSDAPAVCVLDTGVTRAHPLLDVAIAPGDAMAVDLAWGPNDDGGGPGMMGHGTEMAGLAAYGDLTGVLAGSAPVELRHTIESVKILPPLGRSRSENYAAITAQAVARPELNSPGRLRTFSLAVTAADIRDQGQPTSWSSAIDALAAGRMFDPVTSGLVYLDDGDSPNRRLFVVSAGNVDAPEVDHLVRSDLQAIHDPAQAWNALTVGAYTQKAVIEDPQYSGWTAVAPPGELSPWSTTSVLFQDSWPLKPDVVFEGGNVGQKGSDLNPQVPDLCLLTTHYKPSDDLFVLSYATSAATAQVARLAALVMADYPEFWPETVRALIVNSARWTKAMEDHCGGGSSKRDRARLSRRYGFGVPDVERARRSANDALTLIVQSSIRPFTDGKMREIHLHALPWPKAVLEELGGVLVRLRVTLSYFVEPNPGRRGWKKRHRYASHGLRFDVMSPTEDLVAFRKRLNKRALEEDEKRPRSSDTDGWFLGEVSRSKGSIHSDAWTGTADDLARRSVIGVFPVSGWWKDQPKRDRSDAGARYALVVTIETDAEGVDIWTPVAHEISVPVEVPARAE